MNGETISRGHPTIGGGSGFGPGSGGASLGLGSGSGGITAAGVRFPQAGHYLVFAVDYDGLILPGNDATASPGASPVLATALAAAVARPFKTLERVQQVIPHWGNDAILYVLIKGRTGGVSYLKIDGVTAQDSEWRSMVGGYRRCVIRSTGDFSDTTFDRIQLGFVPAPGTNAAGYNPTAGATNNTIPCQLNGGGAAGLPVEVTGFSTITGYRIRFDPNTTTVALRNACSNVYKNTAAQIVVGANLPAVPVLTDVFYIESTALQLSNGSCHVGDNSKWFVVGERWLGTTSIEGITSILQFTNCESLGTIDISRSSQVGFFSAYNFIDNPAVGTFVGTAGRHTGTIFAFRFCQIAAFNNGAILCALGLTLSGVTYSSNIGSGSIIAFGIADGGFASSNSVTNTSQVPNRSYGSYLVLATTQPLRITAGTVGLSLAGSGGIVSGVDFASQATKMILISGLGGDWTLEGLTSVDGGNTGIGLQLVGQKTSVRYGIGLANTLATTGNEILLAGNAVGTFAGLATCNYFDTSENNVVGLAGVVMDTPAKVFSNQSGGTIPAFSVVRSNGVTAQCTTARANTAVNAAGIIGVCINTPLAGAPALVASIGSVCPVQFDASAAVAAGAIAYLSTGTAGDAQTLIPALAATNQKNRLGIIGSFAGTIGVLAFTPDKLATLADGLA